MKKQRSFWSAYVLSSIFIFIRLAASQNPGPAKNQEQGSQPASIPTSFTSAKGFVLEDSTPVRLRINRTISSADARTGDTVDFEVLDDITLNGTLIIPKGSLAFATVTDARPKRRMTRGGKLDISIDCVKLADGEKAPLRAVKDLNGGGASTLRPCSCGRRRPGSRLSFLSWIPGLQSYF